MLHHTVQRMFMSPAPAAATWGYLADPTAVAAASSHPTVAALDGPLQVGSTWTEYHIDEGCDFDSVLWRCTALEPGRLVNIEGRQAGALQRATTVLHAVDDRVEIESSLRIRLSLRAPGSLVVRAIAPLLLVTPFGRTAIQEAFDQSVEDDVRALTALAA